MTHEDELRRLLRGGPIPAEDERLAQALRRLRSTLSSPPPEDVAETHLASITAAATEAAHEAPTPEPDGRLRRWGRRVAAAGAVKIATVATVAAAATGGGLAATGQLPPPVQEQVSDVLSHLGITVPSGTETSSEQQPDDLGTTPADPATVDSAPPSSTIDTPSDDTAGGDAPADAPDDAPAEDPPTSDDGDVPFDETPTGEPTETPSEPSSEYPSGLPEDATGDAPVGTDASEERSGSADAYTGEDGPPDDGSGDTGYPD